MTDNHDDPPDGFEWLSKSLGVLWPTYENARANWPVFDDVPSTGNIGDFARLRDGSIWQYRGDGEWLPFAPPGTLMPPDSRA